MKKLIIMLSVLVLGLSTQAQFASKLPTVAGDTLVGVDTVFKSISVTAGYPSIGIGGNMIVDTLALTGKAYLLRSMDNGVTYQMYDSASYVSPTLNSTTTGTTATKVFQFEKTAPSGSVYQVVITSATALARTRVAVWQTLHKYTWY